MSSPRLLFALFCLGVIPMAGAETELIQSTASRYGISLNGSWRVIVDPYESGYYDYRYRPQSDGGFGANKKPKSKSDLIEYDFDTADRLQVPGDWNTQRPDLMFNEGTVWYKREFDCPTPAGHRIFVWFGSANYRAMVFINGIKVGEHAGGFTPFQFEITALQPLGRNLVRQPLNGLLVLLAHRLQCPPLKSRPAKPARLSLLAIWSIAIAS